MIPSSNRNHSYVVNKQSSCRAVSPKCEGDSKGVCHRRQDIAKGSPVLKHIYTRMGLEHASVTADPAVLKTRFWEGTLRLPNREAPNEAR
jgi:hypothetical protein